MANPTPYQPLYQFYDEIRPKPKVADKAKLQQIAKINAVSQVLSLVGQGVAMKKGATIAPMQDKVTPYLLGQDQLLKKQEADEDMASRENLFKTMEKDIEYNVDQDNIAKKNAIEEDRYNRTQKNANEQKTLDRDARAKYATLYSMPVEERIRIEREDAANKAKADLKIVTYIKDGGSDVGLTSTDINSYWGKIYNDPELMKIVLKDAPLQEIEKIEGNMPSDDFKMAMIEKLYPQIKGMYTPESVRGQGNSAPAKTGQTGGEKQNDTEAKKAKILRIIKSTDPWETRAKVLTAILKKEWGYSQEEADAYIEKNLPKEKSK
jgi:hypothetical protein